MSNDEGQSARNGPLLDKPLNVLEFQLRLNELLSDISPDAEITYFCARRLQESLLKKYPDLPSLGFERVNTRAAALGTFQSCEASNRNTNERLTKLLEKGLDVRDPIERALFMAQSRFATVIEEAFDPEGIPACFGPGSTSSLRYTEASMLAKCLHVQPEATDGLLSHFDAVASLMPHVPPHSVRTSGGVLSFVPKDSRTDRTILIEPDWNIAVQKGLGSLLRTSLKRCTGIDLDLQAERHHAFLLTNRDHSLATLDLANASNSISRGVVRLLGDRCLSRKGRAFLAALDHSRSPSYRRSRRATTSEQFEMWSSMGNGYTFELESLIFWALADACTAIVCGHPQHGKVVSVFGDDIIVDVTVVDLLQQVLAFLGFTLNLEKSFFEGPFRESCGLEVYNTMDVTPFRIKRVIETHGQVYWLANSLRRWWTHFNEAAVMEGVSLPSVIPLWSWVWRHIPRDQILRGPESLDGHTFAPDGHLHVSPEYLPKGRIPRDQHEGRLYRTWVSDPVTVPLDVVNLAYALSLREIEPRRITHYTPPHPEGDGSFNGKPFSTECQTRGRGVTRKAWVKVFARPLPRVAF